MRVAIDFGTTHPVAAVVDRGNYPVASFEGRRYLAVADCRNHVGELRFGLDAVRHEPGCSVLRSFKHSSWRGTSSPMREDHEALDEQRR